MSNCDIISGFGEVEWHSRWLALVKYFAFSSLIFISQCLPARVSIFSKCILGVF